MQPQLQSSSTHRVTSMTNSPVWAPFRRLTPLRSSMIERRSKLTMGSSHALTCLVAYVKLGCRCVLCIAHASCFLALQTTHYTLNYAGSNLAAIQALETPAYDNIQIEDALLQGVARVQLDITLISRNITGLQSKLNEAVNLVSNVSNPQSMQAQLTPILSNVSDFESAANCHFIATSFGNFKRTFCNSLENSLQWMTFSLFVIGISCCGIGWCSRWGSYRVQFIPRVAPLPFDENAWLVAQQDPTVSSGAAWQQQQQQQQQSGASQLSEKAAMMRESNEGLQTNEGVEMAQPSFRGDADDGGLASGSAVNSSTPPGTDSGYPPLPQPLSPSAPTASPFRLKPLDRVPSRPAQHFSDPASASSPAAAASFPPAAAAAADGEAPLSPSNYSYSQATASTAAAELHPSPSPPQYHTVTVVAAAAAEGAAVEVASSPSAAAASAGASSASPPESDVPEGMCPSCDGQRPAAVKCIECEESLCMECDKSVKSLCRMHVECLSLLSLARTHSALLSVLCSLLCVAFFSSTIHMVPENASHDRTMLA